jgi:hypothetical protein
VQRTEEIDLLREKLSDLLLVVDRSARGRQERDRYNARRDRSSHPVEYAVSHDGDLERHLPIDDAAAREQDNSPAPYPARLSGKPQGVRNPCAGAGDIAASHPLQQPPAA